MHSDVSALVLTIGEPTFEECISRLHSQTLEPAKIVVVRNNFVLHEAYNEGISQIDTEFFIQCDADMLIDPDCIEILRAAMDDTAGVSIAYLEDGILGTVQAIKLFRTSCLCSEPFTMGVTTDTDCISRIRKNGFEIRFASRDESKFDHDPDVLAEHCPDYENPTYTFGRFMRLGAQVRTRNCYDEFQSCLDALKKSSHTMSNTALVAFCHGFFRENTQSKSEYFNFTQSSKESELFNNFLENRNPVERIFSVTKIPGLDIAKELQQFNNS